MGKVLFTQRNESGTIHYVAGKVTFVQEGTGTMQGKVVNVGMVLNVYNPETKAQEKKYLNIGFFNSEKSKNADRIKSAGVRAGSFIMAVVGDFRDGDKAPDGTGRLNAYGFSFDFSCVREIKAEKSYTVVAGQAHNLKDDGSKLSFAVPVTIWNRDKGEKEIQWVSVTAMNNENRKTYDYAKRVIKDGSVVGLLCSAIRENTVGEKVYRNVLMFDGIASPAVEAKAK